MTTPKRIFLLLALAGCLAASGCGSDDEGGKPVPAAQAQELQTRLSEAERRLNDGSAGACRDILSDTQPAVARTLDSIPNSVDPDVRDALSQSFDNLWNLVDDECQNLQSDEPAQTTPTQPDTTPPETTPTTPPDTTPTTPPDTTPTTPGDETVPPDGDGENGGAIPQDGNGGGVGPGAAKEKKEKGA